jgi:hypothetical protein
MTGANAGINYFMWHLENETTTKGIAVNLSIPDGYWVHYYNKTLEKWQSIWVGYVETANTHIDKFDVVAITVGSDIKSRINTTCKINYSQSKIATPNYNYIGWTADTDNVTNMTNYGFENGDWIHHYDTIRGTWQSRWLSHAGDKYNISPYDIIIGVVDGNRNITIGG